MKKPTKSIKDIAREANVSHSTVSRALRGSPLVKPETAEEIRRIADESNFRISAVARSLATGRTHAIGVVVTTLADPFAAEVVQGIEETANANNYSVVLATSSAKPDREMRAVHSFEERRVDGIIVMSSRVGSLYLTQLAKMKVPIVLINNQHKGDFSHSVMIDNVGASEVAVRHLIELGHRRIAYLGDAGGFESDVERRGGYERALEAAGLGVAPELITQGNSTPEGAMSVMERLLHRDDRPTAVFCYNDVTAMGVLRSARIHSLDVPGDLSILGFDDLAIASYLNPTLTTVRQPKLLMGSKATELLFDLLKGHDRADRYVVPGELILRESTGKPR